MLFNVPSERALTIGSNFLLCTLQTTQKTFGAILRSPSATPLPSTQTFLAPPTPPYLSMTVPYDYTTIMHCLFFDSVRHYKLSLSYNILLMPPIIRNWPLFVGEVHFWPLRPCSRSFGKKCGYIQFLKTENVIKILQNYSKTTPMSFII